MCIRDRFYRDFLQGGRLYATGQGEHVRQGRRISQFVDGGALDQSADGHFTAFGRDEDGIPRLQANILAGIPPDPVSYTHLDVYKRQAYGNFENEVDKVLQSYFNACAIRMSCVDLARAFVYLANRGVPLGESTPLLPARTTKQVNALLATCGLYDEAGDFAYRVGMPGKSGVGGGIMALIPGELSICVWSPEMCIRDRLRGLGQGLL